MANETIKKLMGHVINGTVPTEYEAGSVDIEAALHDEIAKLVGNLNLYRRNKLDLFELLQESIDEVVPNKVEAILGMFAEVRTFRQGQRVTFKVRKGKLRAKQFVTRVAIGGLFETFRLDSDTFDVSTEAYGGAALIDFERYLDGAESIMELYDIIVEALVDKAYELVQTCLLNAWMATGQPSANRVYFSGFDAASMQELCNTVAAYGSPVIYCSPEFAATMSNAITYATGTGTTDKAFPQADLNDIREKGYIGKFRSTPVVVFPQSFEDESNTVKTINPRVAYVLPTGKEKLVKIAYEGDTVVDDYKNQDRSMEIQAYKKMGAAIVTTPNFWGMYYNASISDGGWDALANPAG